MGVLTVGSVVAVKERREKRMITGYLRSPGNGKVYDYASVPFPAGAGDPGSGLLFNANAIESVLFEGYKDELYEKLCEFLDNQRPEVEKVAAEQAAPHDESMVMD